VGSAFSSGSTVELRSSSTVVGLLAMHERWLVRLATGPAVARVAWEWDGGDGASSSEWGIGWINELALAVPVAGPYFLDVSYHDWLFAPSTPPAYPGADAIELRLRGSTLSLGLGRRF
jgi:hypothetical protein